MKGSYRKRLGYMPQKLGYYGDFSVYAFLRYMASLKGLARKEAARKIDGLLQTVNLSGSKEKRMDTLSGGMLQRTLLAASLLGEPDVLVLDEPTSGLDPRERAAFRDYIAGISRNRIVIYATHIVSDIECVAKRIIVLKQGRIVADGSPQALIEGLSGKVCEVPCIHPDIDLLRARYASCGIRQKKEAQVERFVGDNIPQGFGRIDDDIGLEDVYIYYTGH